MPVCVLTLPSLCVLDLMLHQYQWFDVEELIVSTVRAFAAPLDAKQLRIELDLHHIGDMISRPSRSNLLVGVSNRSLRQIEVAGSDGASDVPRNAGVHSMLKARAAGLKRGASGIRASASVAAAPDAADSSVARTSQKFEVKGDRLRVRQVLSNFISNAIKFTAVAGTITICLSGGPLNDSRSTDIDDDTLDSAECTPTLHVARLDNGHRRVVPPPRRVQIRLSVIDTGCGMNEAAVSRMFQQYSMVKTTRTDSVKRL